MRRAALLGGLTHSREKSLYSVVESQPFVKPRPERKS